nr:COX15/CtaA family protein [Saprospiraceae bacterium]
MNRYSKSVQIWIWIGIVMVFFQIVIGGITRLTGSGLSITKWEIVTGTLPPLNEKQWEEAFELYRETPQYQQINRGMSLADFKYIYFWEYVHRVWARLMFFVFLLPFIYFLIKKKLDKLLIKKLLSVIGLAAVVASIGWIMVASGLQDRPWVNAYKLSIHLLLGLTLFTYLAWVGYGVIGLRKLNFSFSLKPWYVFLVLLVLQIFLGGMMSGTKAALFYPTWPDMHGELIPGEIMDSKNWTANNFTYYDDSLFMSAFVQFFHRMLAYVLLVAGLFLSFRYYKKYTDPLLRKAILIFSGILLSQVVVGIVTVVNSWGEIPVFWGVLHQTIASILLLSLFFIIYLGCHRSDSGKGGNSIDNSV